MFSLKKVLLGVSCILALGGFIFGTDLFSYISTAGHKIKNATKSAVPIDFEIQRARETIDSLMPEIKQNMGTIASEEVALNKLNDDINKLDSRMKDAKGELVILQTALDSDKNKAHFIFCDRTYARSQVENDLSARFERYQIDQSQSEALIKMKSMREQSLQAAKSKLQEYLAQKQELEVKLQQLDARLKMVELAKTTSEFNFNEDNLGQAKKLISELQGRLEVEERLVGNHGDLSNEVVLKNDTTKNKDISSRVTQYFGLKPSDPPVEVVKK